MAVPKREVITVRPRGGKLVHTTEPGSALLGRTHCGRRCAGWVVATGAISCPGCKRALGRT